MINNSHNVPTKNKLGVQRVFQFTFVNKDYTMFPTHCFIIAETLFSAKQKFSSHLGDTFEVLDVHTIDSNKHDVVILSSCPMYDSLIHA